MQLSAKRPRWEPPLSLGLLTLPFEAARGVDGLGFSARLGGSGRIGEADPPHHRDRRRVAALPEVDPDEIARAEGRGNAESGSALAGELKHSGAGHPAAVRAMTDVVRVWGTLSIVAIHAEPVPVHLYQMFARELVMHGARLYAREDWEEAIRLAAGGVVPLAPLVSRKIPLEALQQGMEQALGGGPVMKVLVDLTT